MKSVCQNQSPIPLNVYDTICKGVYRTDFAKIISLVKITANVFTKISTPTSVFISATF